MEGGYGLHAPGLAFRAFSLRPGDDRLVRVQDQPCTRVGEFNTVSAGFPYVEEEGLVDRVLIGPVFDIHALFEEKVGGLENVFARIGGKRKMVEATAFPSPIIGVDNVI